MSAEPCVYERLWESIVVLRESGQRYGMSERDIERFISQVLQTNEPHEELQPPFPLLRATAKCALALVLVLVLALGLSQSGSGSESPSLGLNWSCLGAARLLELPIAHKYHLHEYRGWFRGGVVVHSSVNSSASRPDHTLAAADMSSLLRPLLDLVCLSQDDFCQNSHASGLTNSTSVQTSDQTTPCQDPTP